MKSDLKKLNLLIALILSGSLYLTKAQGQIRFLNLLSEEHFKEEFNRLILPFWEQGTSKYLSNSDGTKLFTWQKLHPEAKGQVIISHGYAENTLKYREFCYLLFQQGYSVFLLDHRGHGRSSRLRADPTVTHIERFSDYSLDFKNYYESLQLNHKIPVYLFGHSMGGAIALDFMEQYPNHIDALLLNSPLLKPQTYGLPIGLIHGIFSFLSKLQGHTHIAPLHKTPNHENWTFRWSGTSSELRFNRFKQDALQEHQALGGPSHQWILAMLEALPQRLEPKRLDAISIPVFIAKAGQDSIVSIEPMTALCRQLKTCQIHNYEQSKHEIWNETNAIRETFFHDLLNFFDSIVAHPPR